MSGREGSLRMRGALTVAGEFRGSERRGELIKKREEVRWVRVLGFSKRQPRKTPMPLQRQNLGDRVLSLWEKPGVNEGKG